MAERIKVERRIAVYLASEEAVGSPDTTPFPERARDIYENFVMPAEKQARAEVLVACAKRASIRLRDAEKYLADDHPKSTCAVYHRGEIAAIKYLGTEISELQPAAAELEELLEQALEAALPHAAEQLFKAITEGGEFAVGSPLAKVKKRVEELLRKAELEGLRFAREFMKEGLDCFSPCSMVDRRIAELKEAHAILQKK